MDTSEKQQFFAEKAKEFYRKKGEHPGVVKNMLRDAQTPGTMEWNAMSPYMEKYPILGKWLRRSDMTAWLFSAPERMVAVKEALMDVLADEAPAYVHFAILWRSEAMITEQPIRWDGIDLGMVHPVDRRDIVASLYHGRGMLTQERFNYLFGTDVENCTYWPSPLSMNMADYEKSQGSSVDISEMVKFASNRFAAPEEVTRLGKAFVKQMLEEAANYPRHKIVLGEYKLILPQLPLLEDMTGPIGEIRLVFSPEGILASLRHETYDHWLAPFFWSPEKQSHWYLFGQAIGWPLHIVMASIWRDAVVVRRRFYKERSREYNKKVKGNRRHPDKIKLMLPRTVTEIAWSTDAEREAITHRSHGVEAFYRSLPYGWEASDQAKQNAHEFGYPEPPAGYTFVKPHSRGGEVEAGEKVEVVCRGLQVAKIALSGSAMLADDNYRKLPDIKVVLELRQSGLTLEQIGELYGSTRQAVQHKIKVSGEVDPGKDMGKGRFVNPKLPSRATILKLLEKNSKAELIKILGVDRDVFNDYLYGLDDKIKRADAIRRYHQDPQEGDKLPRGEVVYDLYHNQGYKVSEIAKMYGVTDGAVSLCLKRYEEYKILIG